MERPIDPSAPPVERKNSEKQVQCRALPFKKAMAELTLLKTPVDAVSDTGQRPSNADEALP